MDLLHVLPPSCSFKCHCQRQGFVADLKSRNSRPAPASPHQPLGPPGTNINAQDPLSTVTSPLSRFPTWVTGSKEHQSPWEAGGHRGHCCSRLPALSQPVWSQLWSFPAHVTDPWGPSVWCVRPGFSHNLGSAGPTSHHSLQACGLVSRLGERQRDHSGAAGQPAPWPLTSPDHGLHGTPGQFAGLP